ncbi:MAG: DHHA1 domain-containing protein [Microthrixaceae bacterium]|nr:DHHA1 domain-containing protein [Microthrixaceae bacterium]
MRELAVALRDKPGVEVVVLGSSPGGKGVVLVSAVTPESGLHAADLIAEAAKLVGGGGKAADLAMAGGKAPEHLDEALSVVRGRLGIA